ncbi:MAG: DUF2516 family protein [Micromonosporaceae bacterium]
MDALAVVRFAGPIVDGINLLIFIFAVAIEVVAFVHCLLQRAESFKAVDTLPKGLWLALTGGAAVLSVAVLSSPIGILGLIGIIAASIYLLDVRPAIRDLAGGSGGAGGW